MKRGTCPAGGRAAAGLGRRETPSQPLTHGHPNGLLVEKENNMSEGKSHFLQTDPKLFYAHTCGCPFVSVPTTGGPGRPVSLSWLFAARPPPSSVHGRFLSSSPPRAGVPLGCGRGEACSSSPQPRAPGRSGGRGDGPLSTLLYWAVYNSRLFLLWQSFLT